MQNTAIVNKIIRFSSVDGPGNRTVIFLQGCNFNCRYCHNPETIGACIQCGECLAYCKTGAITLIDGEMSYDRDKCVNCDACFHNCPHGSSPKTSRMAPEEVIEEVEKNMPYIRGITVSGGECTLWRDFLVDLLTLAKKKGLSTMLDSNGTYDFSKDKALMDVVDAVMLDVKAFNRSEHEKVTGIHNDMVLSNVCYLAECDKLFEVRTVAVSELFDVKHTVEETSKLLKKLGKQERIRYKLIKYRPIGVREQFRSYETPTNEHMNELRDIAYANGMKDIVII